MLVELATDSYVVLFLRYRLVLCNQGICMIFSKAHVQSSAVLQHAKYMGESGFSSGVFYVGVMPIWS